MKQKREQHDEVIKRRVEGQAQSSIEQAEEEKAATEEAEADVKISATIEPGISLSYILILLYLTVCLTVGAKKRKRESFRDEEYFLPMFQQNRAKEDAYASPSDSCTMH